MTHHPPDVRRYFGLRKALWRLRSAGPVRLLQMALRRMLRPAWYAGLILWVVGCTLRANPVLPTATPIPPTATPAPASSGWVTLQPGIEERILRPPNSFFAQLVAIRIDPQQVDFRVHYRPGDPLFADDWRTELPDAAVIINSNFFDGADRVTGTLFADGVQHGTPYRRRGGTFYVQNGVPGIQSNLVQPYADERYDQAVQAFPMLVTDGQQSYFDTRADRPTRRTVIALDEQGRVIVIVTSFGGITLIDLSAYLPTTDLDIVNALNLDGGGSTLMDVQAGESTRSVPSFDPVPAVVAVYPR
ncbi:MAG: phosphodiester glycosidase family protein [Chloroflexota bacterium]